MKQHTFEEMESLFADLDVGDDGQMSFHDVQQRVRDFRAERIERMKVVFPKMAGLGEKNAKLRKGQTRKPASGRTGRVAAGTGLKRRTGKVSREVAPPSMFQKDRGMNNMEIASYECSAQSRRL